MENYFVDDEVKVGSRKTFNVGTTFDDSFTGTNTINGIRGVSLVDAEMLNEGIIYMTFYLFTYENRKCVINKPRLVNLGEFTKSVNSVVDKTQERSMPRNNSNYKWVRLVSSNEDKESVGFLEVDKSLVIDDLPKFSTFLDQKTYIRVNSRRFITIGFNEKGICDNWFIKDSSSKEFPVDVFLDDYIYDEISLEEVNNWMRFYVGKLKNSLYEYFRLD